jgi:hypothetical protein
MFGGQIIPFVLKKHAFGKVLRLIHRTQSYHPSFYPFLKVQLFRVAFNVFYLFCHG